MHHSRGFDGPQPGRPAYRRAALGAIRGMVSRVEAGDRHAVLVTGAAGFIGRDLVVQLLASGYRVKALVRPTRAREVAVRVAGTG